MTFNTSQIKVDRCCQNIFFTLYIFHLVQLFILSGNATLSNCVCGLSCLSIKTTENKLHLKWVIRAADFYCKFSCKTLHTVTSNLYVTTYLNTREEHQNVFMIPSMWTNNFARLKDQKSSYLHVKTHSWTFSNLQFLFSRFSSWKN